MMVYQLVWKRVRDDHPLPLITAAEEKRNAILPEEEGLEGLAIISRSADIATVESCDLERVENFGFHDHLHYRVVVEDVDAPKFEQVLRAWPPLVELTLIAHVVEERPAAPVTDIPLADGRVVDMYADPWSGDMQETRSLWARPS